MPFLGVTWPVTPSFSVGSRGSPSEFSDGRRGEIGEQAVFKHHAMGNVPKNDDVGLSIMIHGCPFLITISTSPGQMPRRPPVHQSARFAVRCAEAARP